MSAVGKMMLADYQHIVQLYTLHTPLVKRTHILPLGTLRLAMCEDVQTCLHRTPQRTSGDAGCHIVYTNTNVISRRR